MKLHGLLVAAIVLAALSGTLYWSNHRKPVDDSTVKASPDAPVKIVALNEADIASLTIHRKDEPELDLSRNSSGAWQITAPKALAADQIAVSGILSTLSLLNSERLVEDRVTELGQYGLAAPTLEVDVALKSGKTQKLLVGNQTPSGSAYYFMLGGDPRLFTLASYSKNSLDKSANDLRDKRLLTTDFDKASQIELLAEKSGKKQDVTLARNKDEWQILKPRPLRADGSQVEELIRTLRDGRIDTASDTDDAKNASAFRSATAVATVRVTDTSSTEELEVRKSANDYLAKSSVLSGIYKVPAAVGTGLDKSLDDFRNKKLFDFGYQEPSKIELHDGAKSYFLTHAGSDWWGADSKKLDEGTVQALLGKIRDLAAQKFPDAGFTTPILELSVSSDDGKRVEKVQIAKNGDTYIAKRANEPALYEVAGSMVTELQKAAAEVKPAPEPKK